MLSSYVTSSCKLPLAIKSADTPCLCKYCGLVWITTFVEFSILNSAGVVKYILESPFDFGKRSQSGPDNTIPDMHVCIPGLVESLAGPL